jgi:hypothetical protein
LEEADIESAVRGFYILKADGAFPGGMAPVGVDHDELEAAFAALTGGEPVVGDLAAYDEVRAERNSDGGLSLMGLHTYTDVGRSAVRAKALRGYSSDLAPPGLGQKRDGTPVPEWVPFGGTLTNRPFVRGMGAVAASDAVPLIQKNPRENPMLDALNGVLGLADGDTADKQIAAIIALKDEAAKVHALESKVTALTDDVTKVASDRDALAAEVTALTDAAEKRIGDDAVNAGRVALADVGEYLKAYKLMGPEYANKVHPADKIATAPVVLTDGKVDEGADTPATIGATWEAAYAVALSESNGDERKAYALAREATREARNAEYLAAKAQG